MCKNVPAELSYSLETVKRRKKPIEWCEEIKLERFRQHRNVAVVSFPVVHGDAGG